MEVEKNLDTPLGKSHRRALCALDTIIAQQQEAQQQQQFVANPPV